MALFEGECSPRESEVQREEPPPFVAKGTLLVRGRGSQARARPEPAGDGEEDAAERGHRPGHRPFPAAREDDPGLSAERERAEPRPTHPENALRRTFPSRNQAVSSGKSRWMRAASSAGRHHEREPPTRNSAPIPTAKAGDPRRPAPPPEPLPPAPSQSTLNRRGGRPPAAVASVNVTTSSAEKVCTERRARTAAPRSCRTAR